MLLANRVRHQLSVINSIHYWGVCSVEVLLSLGVVEVYVGEGLDVDVGTVDVAGVMQLPQYPCLR